MEQLTDDNNCELTGEEDDKTPTEEETGKWSYYHCGLSFQDMDTEAMVTNTPPSFYGGQVTCGGTSPFRMPEVVTTHANSSSMSIVSGAQRCQLENSNSIQQEDCVRRGGSRFGEVLP